MEETYHTKAIILKRTAFREADSRTTVYSADKGKLELVVRGARKITSKLAAHLEPISLSRLMVVRGKQFDYIGGATAENCYFNIKNDLKKLELAGRALGLFHKLVKERDGAEAEALFNLLRQYLAILENEAGAEKKYSFFYYCFVLKLLAGLGYKPELEICLACKNKIRPAGNFFDPARGGLVCPICAKNNAPGLTISENGIKILRLIIDKNLAHFHLKNLQTNVKLNQEVAGIIDAFFNYNFN